MEKERAVDFNVFATPAAKLARKAENQMSFETEGFFSSEIEKFRINVRNEQPTKAWFDYALDLNRLGFDMLRQVDTLRADRRQLLLNANFVRVHQSFQSALLLAERGLIPDSRVVLRSGVESAIASNARHPLSQSQNICARDA